MLRSIWIRLALATGLLAGGPANVAGQPTPKPGYIQMSQLILAAHDTCTPVRLDKPPGLMAKIPVNDQSFTTFCWAYAGNQMVDAWRIRTYGLATSSSSALSSAFSHLAFTRNSTFSENDSVSMFKYLSSVRSLKLCDRSVIRDLVDVAPAQVSKDVFNQIRLLHSQLRSSTIASQSQLTIVMSRAFPSIAPSRLASIPADMLRIWSAEGSWPSFAARVKEYVCAEESYSVGNFPTPSVMYTYENANVLANIEQMRQSIDRHLSSFHPTNNPNVLPIGIQFCPEILFEPMEPRMLVNGRLNACEGGAKHTAVIVGRRPATWTDRTTGQKIGMCQYLIRNSEGPSCLGFDRPSDVFTPSNTCENGQIWVDELTLMGNTDVAYFVRE
jgi:hypothetical protein